jgi:FkbM family methyltransferase
MAIKLWKKIEKSDSYRRVKLLIKRLAGKELWVKLDVKCKTVKVGGWHINPAAITKTGCLVYSFGIEKDLRFDLALIRDYSLAVHAFDPTPSTIDWISQIDTSPNFHFHPWAVTGLDGNLILFPRIKRDGTKSITMYSLVTADPSSKDKIEVPAFSPSSLLAKLGHDKNNLQIIKIDIEGAEYEVLDDLLKNEINPPQILVEFHHRFAGIGKHRTLETISKLREAGYFLFSISVTGCEYSFIHRDALAEGELSRVAAEQHRAAPSPLQR